MLKIKSLIAKRREINRRKGLKGVAARLRKIAEAPAPTYPIDRSGDYRIVHVEDCMNGVIIEHILMLTPVKEGQGRCDQWATWLDAQYQGIMGWYKATELTEKQFMRVRAIS